MSELRAFALCGPTASGKSELASHLAAQIGAEIVNADSRQVYTGMRIGTGWPTEAQFARAPHHGFGIVAPDERYSAGRFVADARATIAAIGARGRHAIVVGGTGFYLEALAGSMRLDRPFADDELRARIRGEASIHPPEILRGWLDTLDADAARRIEPGDRYRTLRALEAALAAREGAPPRAALSPPVRLRFIVLEAERAELARRIAARVRVMFDGGLVGEALQIRSRYGDAPALTGIGYAEALAYADGLATRAEALSTAAQRTRAYAKRQQTWFRRLEDAARIAAFETDTPAALLALAREWMRAA